jgi:hypothetical protein
MAWRCRQGEVCIGVFFREPFAKPHSLPLPGGCFILEMPSPAQQLRVSVIGIRSCSCAVSCFSRSLLARLFLATNAGATTSSTARRVSTRRVSKHSGLLRADLWNRFAVWKVSSNPFLQRLGNHLEVRPILGSISRCSIRMLVSLWSSKVCEICL